jgi:DNA-binding transcriptional ArsR family regulator
MRPARKNDVFDAVAHPVRRRILLLLKDGARPASELAQTFKMSLAAVSLSDLLDRVAAD